MREGIDYTGIPSAAELAACKGIPSRERMERGAVAVIECVQCIPCNPCESACPFGAITVGSPMTNAPVLDGEKCIGCGSCIARCPGLAITVINLTHGENMATLDFPYEYLPLPEAGSTVTAVDRSGEAVCDAKVLSVSNTAPGETCVVRIEFPSSQADRVKSIRRIKEGC